jgi:hypothetical protein
MMKFRTVFFISVLLNFVQAQAQDHYADAIMKGISNHGKNKKEGYITAGDRTYIIGTQDGDFPDLGRHVEGSLSDTSSGFHGYSKKRIS